MVSFPSDVYLQMEVLDEVDFQWELDWGTEWEDNVVFDAGWESPCLTIYGTKITF